MVPLTLAVGASIAWGASDFLGGLVARRLPVVVVLLGAQAVGLMLAAVAWSLAGAQMPTRDALTLGAAAGIFELLGFACLYRGLAIGQMAAVAPLAALAAVLPVTVAVGGGAQVALLEGAGMLLAIVGTAFTAADSGTRRLVRGAGLGLGAALCFGAFFVFLGEASESAGPAAPDRRARTWSPSPRSAHSTWGRTSPMRARRPAVPMRRSRCSHRSTR